MRRMHPIRLALILGALFCSSVQATGLFDIVTKGSTSRSVTVDIIDSTDGTPETGVVFNTSGIDLWYRREGAARVAITEATLASLTTAWASGGFLHISDGTYRLDLPDAAFASGANYVDFGGTVTGMIVIGGRVRLVDYSLEDSVRMGLTALPNATPGAANGVQIAGSNAATTYASISVTDGLTVARSSSNTSAVSFTGNGTGHGLVIASGSGATGNGINVTAASTNGNAIALTGAGTGNGLIATGGATGNGINGVGGSTSGNGIRAAGTAGNSAAMNLVGQGSAAGLLSTGGATGHGASLVGGSTSGSGLRAAASTSGTGIAAVGVGTTQAGIEATGGSTSSAGIRALGGGTGAGLAVTGGATGAGFLMTGGSTSGNALSTAQTAPAGPVPGWGIIESGTLQSATGTTAVLRSATSFPDATLEGATLVITGGTGAGQSRVISAWANSTDTATVATWTTNPTSSSTYEVWGTSASSGGGGGGLDAAGVRAAVGLASANLDTQLNGISTKTGFLPSATAGSAGGVFIAGTNAATSITSGLTANITGNLSGSVGSVSGAVGSVTGNVGGNVTGSVGSVATGGITTGSFASGAINAAAIATDAIGAAELASDAASEIGTATWATGTRTLSAGTNIVLAKGTGVTGFNDLDAAGIRSAVGLPSANLNTQLGDITAGLNALNDPSAATIADAVWDEARAGHTTAGTFGNYLDSAISGVSTGGVSAGEIADAVWDEARTGHTTSGTFGFYVDAAISSVGGGGGGGDVNVVTIEGTDATDVIDARIAAGLATYDPPTRAELTNDTNSVLAAVGDVPTNAELATALSGADDAVLAAIAGLNNLSAADVWSYHADGSTPAECLLAAAAAYAGGNTSQTGNVATYKQVGGNTNRMVMTISAPGNRTMVVTCPSH